MAWNRPSENAVSRRVNVDATSPSRHWWYISGVIVVLGAAIAAWWLWPEGEMRQDAASTKKGLIKEVAPVAKPRTQVAEAESAVKPIAAKPALWRGHAIVSKSATTNSTDYVIETIVCDNGKTYTHEYQIRKPPLFDNEVDNLLLQIAMRQPGAQTPPLPQFGDLDAGFREAIKVPIIALPTDSEEVRAQKRIVKELRIGLIDIIEREKISVAEAIYRDHREFNENVPIRNNALGELRDIVKSGDDEGARKYLETINRAFENMGIEQLEMPTVKEQPFGGKRK